MFWMRLLVLLLTLSLSPSFSLSQDPEWPKDVPKDWAKPDLAKESAKFPGTLRIEFAGEKAKYVILHTTSGKAIIYESKDWTGNANDKFLLTQAYPCTGTTTYWRNYAGEIKKLGETDKHKWVEIKERPCTVTPDGNLIIVAKNDRTVQIWETGKPTEPKQEFDAHSRGFMDLFVWGKQHLVTLASTEVRVWNLAKLTDKPKEAIFGNQLRSFALAKPDNRYVALNFGKFVHALDLSLMKGKDLSEDLEAGGRCEFADDGRSLLVLTAAKTATVYQSAGEWKELLKLGDAETKVTTAALSPTGTYLAWFDLKGTMHFTHVASRFEVAKYEMPGFKPGFVTWHPNGNEIYITTENGSAYRTVMKK